MGTKAKLQAGESVMMIKIAYQDPAIYEMVGLLGFDCVWICNEHIGIDPSKLDSIIRACRCSGMEAVVRIKPANYMPMLHVLEFGAKGIMLPRASGPDEVRRIVRDMKFYPEGARGVDGVNAESRFGLIPYEEYLKRTNAENFLIVQIEDPETLPHIEEIAAVDGVDVVFVGPADLSLNLGIAGQFEHPKMMEVYERVVAACEKHHKVPGVACGLPRVKHFQEMGYRFFASIGDYSFLFNGFKNLHGQLEEMGFKLRPIAKF